MSIVASVEWRCEACDRFGALHMNVIPDVLGVMARCKAMHRDASPKCEEYAGDYREIETPPDAVVNDPRARPGIERPAELTRRKRSVPFLAAAAAILGSMPDHRGPMGGGGIPVSNTWAEYREESREERGKRLIPKAEAKRARRRSRPQTHRKEP